MTYATPPGTRDVLPDEMRELRALTDRLRAVFEQAGYGEVWTPAMEYEQVLRRGDDRLAGAGFRLFDEQGQVLVLRSDMTIPIARLVATRYRGSPVPLRFSYFAHAYRVVRSKSGQSREFLQGGIELMGEPPPHGEAEVLGVCIEALEQAGLRRHRIGVGDGSLYRRLLSHLEVPHSERTALLECLSRRNLVELGRRVEALELTSPEQQLLTTLPTLRGGPEILDRLCEPVSDAADNLRALHEQLSRAGVADRIIFDLGLVRELGYYTGAVFEVYDPAVGFALGGGGRYDELVGRFGRDLAACGIALDIQRVHIAHTAEEGLG